MAQQPPDQPSGSIIDSDRHARGERYTKPNINVTARGIGIDPGEGPCQADWSVDRGTLQPENTSVPLKNDPAFVGNDVNGIQGALGDPRLRCYPVLDEDDLS